ncbi:MAG: MOSC domain-containing protein [Deltaproteobacteria bacterium]|jgi:MOSC domain-containing protein YiiM|nr:MOSC domain-containing protein [Deltaproteobacteria bacterium]
MKIVSIAISKKKGTRKTTVPSVQLMEDHGIQGDAHAGPWHRQVSLLATEDIHAMQAKGIDVGFGDFAENIATSGIDLPSLPIGSRLRIGDTVVLEITQIGKECHNKCAIYYQAGDCIMPKRGIFARVITGGEISSDDTIQIIG